MCSTILHQMCSTNTLKANMSQFPLTAGKKAIPRAVLYGSYTFPPRYPLEVWTGMDNSHHFEAITAPGSSPCECWLPAEWIWRWNCSPSGTWRAGRVRSFGNSARLPQSGPEGSGTSYLRGDSRSRSRTWKIGIFSVKGLNNLWIGTNWMIDGRGRFNEKGSNGEEFKGTHLH